MRIENKLLVSKISIKLAILENKVSLKEMFTKLENSTIDEQKSVLLEKIRKKSESIEALYGYLKRIEDSIRPAKTITTNTRNRLLLKLLEKKKKSLGNLD